MTTSFINSSDQLADIFTKSLRGSRIHFVYNNLGDLLQRISNDRSPPMGLLSRIFSVGSPLTDLLRWIFSVGSPSANLFNQISSSGSSQSNLLRQIFLVKSPPADLLYQIFSYESSSAVCNPITSTLSWNTSSLAFPSASNRIKYTFITSLVYITNMFQLEGEC